MSGDAPEEQVDRVPETPIPNTQQHSSQSTPGPSNNSQDTPIASETDLEKFATLPVSERVLTEPLRYVLVEVALTGVIRYNWSLLRPLVEYLTEQTLLDYDAASNADGPGPNRPAFPGEGLGTTIDRFKSYLGRFSQAPWTLQRLCEVLLAPQTQYTQLHKVALAIEKCLLVTSEVMAMSDPPPAPSIQQLAQRPVNSNPEAAAGQHKASRGASGPSDADLERSAAFTSSLLDVHGSPPGAQAGQQAAQGPGVGHGTGGGVHSVSIGAGGPVPVMSNANASHHGHHYGNATGLGSHAGTHAVGAGSSSNHHASHHHHGSHGQGSAGAGISAIEHMEEDHWPDQATLRPGLGGVPPLHGLTGHHLASHHNPGGTGHAQHGSHGNAAALPGVYGNHTAKAGRDAGPVMWHGVTDHPTSSVGALQQEHASAGIGIAAPVQHAVPPDLEHQSATQQLPFQQPTTAQPNVTVPEQQSSMMDAVASADGISVQQGHVGQALQPAWQPVLAAAPYTGNAAMDTRAAAMMSPTAASTAAAMVDSVGAIAEPMLVDVLPNMAADLQPMVHVPTALPTPVSISAGLPAPEASMTNALASKAWAVGTGPPQLQHLQQAGEEDQVNQAGEAPMEG